MVVQSNLTQTGIQVLHVEIDESLYKMIESVLISCSMILNMANLLLLLLLSLALHPPVGFSLLSDSLPFCSFLTLLSPTIYSYHLNIFFNIYSPYLPCSSSNSRTYSFPL